VERMEGVHHGHKVRTEGGNACIPDCVTWPRSPARLGPSTAP
jgi:hypothetical protein